MLGLSRVATRTLVGASSHASLTVAVDTTVRCWSSKSNNNNNSKNKNSNSNSNSSDASSFRARRRPGKNYRGLPKPIKKGRKAKGPKEPMDISMSPRPTIDLSKIKITNVDDEPLEDLSDLGPLASAAIQRIRQGGEVDLETQLKMMDYFTSAPGSTEDRVGERRALALDMFEGEDRDELLAEIDRIVEQERLEYLELPETEPITLEDLQKEEAGGSSQIPSNQLAHGDWGEMLIRTDRSCKMWRGGRIESYRALVIGGNLNGCGGFGIGKAFEPQDAVEIACRMARRNIFFVDRYRNRGLTRDLVGRQNSCKVYLRATDNGLRGNPLSAEILKLMGITNVVAKAHGNRNHYNVVRATFKALQTHESLDDIAMKRGLRLVNLQKAKRLQI